MSRVAALARGMARAARGRAELVQERRETGIAPELVPVLLGTVLVLASLGVTGGVVLLKARGALLLVSVETVAAIVAGGVGAVALIRDDDALATGWWPVTGLERALARLLCTLRPVMLVSLAIGAAPLVAFAAVGTVPVVSALLLAAGIGLQASALTTLELTLVAGAARLLGRDRARRLLVPAALAALLAALVGSAALVDAATRSARVRELVLEWAPPSWFASWAAPLRDARGVLLSLGLTVVVAALALAILSGASATRIEPRAARPARDPLVALLGAWLRLTLRGREGRVVRLLVLAHAREDWRLVVLRLSPLFALVAIAGESLVPPAEIAALVSPVPGPIPLRPVLGLVIAALFVALPGALLLQESEEHAASWLVAHSDLDPSRVARATVAAARALSLPPVLAALATIHVRAGSSAAVALPDLAMAALLFEIVATSIVLRARAWPFSRARGGTPDELTLGIAAGALPVALTLALALAFLYDRNVVTRVAACVAVGAMAAAARAALRRRTLEQGLRLEIAPPP